jgi:Flp pilus assembly protein TadG
MNAKKLIRDERGQTMAEFAIVLPILVVLLFGIVQLGILFNNFVTLTDAVRAGAREASVARQSANPAGDATAAVRSSAADLNQSNLTVSVTSGWLPGSDVTVSASYPYSIKLLGWVVSAGSLTSTTTERVE